MTIGVSTAFSAEFATDVKQAYASGNSGLLQRVRIKEGVVGSTYRFNKLGKGLASLRIPQSDVVPMNVTNSNSTATLSDWEAPEYSDVYDLEKIPYDERSALVKVVGDAIGRRSEQLILDAMTSSASATTVAENFGGTASGLTVVKMRRLKRLMDAAGVPKTDRTFVHDAIGLEQMLGSTAVTNSDYNTVKALVQGELDTFCGFKFICLEDRTEGGVITTASVTTNFGFHKDAVGLAIGMNMRTEINYIPEKTSWLINGLYSAGAVTIDTTGVYKVLTNTTYVL